MVRASCLTLDVFYVTLNGVSFEAGRQVGVHLPCMSSEISSEPGSHTEAPNSRGTEQSDDRRRQHRDEFESIPRWEMNNQRMLGRLRSSVTTAARLLTARPVDPENPNPRHRHRPRSVVRRGSRPAIRLNRSVVAAPCGMALFWRTPLVRPTLVVADAADKHGLATT